MERTLIQIHTTSLIKGLIERTQSIKNLDSETLKGELIEIFISNLIKNFLPSNFEVGSGAIVNQRGEQIPHVDVIIYDNSFLPPFIKEYNLGVYPAESVIAIIEVKSWLDKTVLKNEMEPKAIKLFNLFSQRSSLYPEYTVFKPFFTVFGFYSKTSYKQEKKKELLNWIWDNCKHINAICLLNEYSWFRLSNEKGKNHLRLKDKYNEETKSFFSILLDNIISLTKNRNASLYDIVFNKNKSKARLIVKHRDYFSIYMRDQQVIRKIFELMQLSTD